MRQFWLLLLIPFAGPLRRWFGFHSITGAHAGIEFAPFDESSGCSSVQINGTPAPFRAPHFWFRSVAGFMIDISAHSRKWLSRGEAKRAYFQVIAKSGLDFVMAWSDPD